MNKKQAIAYAQVTLEYMQSSKYNKKITPETFGMEMRQSFNMYTPDIICFIATSQLLSAKKLENIKSGCDNVEQ